MPTQKRLKELFDYDPEGYLLSKKHHSRRLVAQRAGYLDYSLGYMFASVDGKVYRVHRLVWVWHFGPIPSNKVIDHIDRVRTNNRIENLRLATVAENALNRAEVRSFPSGVSWRRRGGVWLATVVVGMYSTRQEAEQAFEAAQIKLAA
jgi:hypothetical protein